MRKIALILLLLAGFCVHAWAAEDDYVKEVREQALNGDAAAMDSLASYYRDGEVVERDIDEAIKWYTAAMEAGYCRSAFRLGALYYQGNGVERDYAKAYELMSGAAKEWPMARNFVRSRFYEGKPVILIDEIMAAAEAGDAEAQYTLSQHYHVSLDMSREMQDTDKALFWLIKSAEQGYLPAQQMLEAVYGGMFLSGQDKDYKDDAKSLYWLNKLVEQNDSEAQAGLARVYINGELGLEPDFAKARTLYLQAAQNGNPHCYTSLAYYYYNGEHVPQDYAEAFRLYLLAAEADIAWAMERVSDMYAAGLGVEKNEAEAQKWLEKAARTTVGEAQYKLGDLLGHGRESSDYGHYEAERWRRLAVEGEGLAAIGILAEIFEQNLAFEPDRAAALKWYKLAAQNGYVEAQNLLGRMYGTDADYYGMQPNNAEAFKWFEMGAAQNDPWSLYSLGQMYLNGAGAKKDYVKVYVLTAKAAVYGRWLMEYDLFKYIVAKALPPLMTPQELAAARAILTEEGLEPGLW